jgi:hypothetical protein
MAFRVRPPALPGELFKVLGKSTRKPTMGRSPRVKEPEYLDAIRQLPCLACGLENHTEAAHLRFSRPGKPNPGMGARNSDKDALPLCSDCHRDQHKTNEEQWWTNLNIDPTKAATAISKAFPDIAMMQSVVLLFRAAAIDEDEFGDE